MEHTAIVRTTNGELTPSSVVRVGLLVRSIPTEPTWPDWAGSDMTTDEQRVIEALASLRFRIDGPAAHVDGGHCYPVYRT